MNDEQQILTTYFAYDGSDLAMKNLAHVAGLKAHFAKSNGQTVVALEGAWKMIRAVCCKMGYELGDIEIAKIF